MEKKYPNLDEIPLADIYEAFMANQERCILDADPTNRRIRRIIENYLRDEENKETDAPKPAKNQ